MREPAAKTVFAYKPLYMQVKESLVGYLIDGTWQPGQLIPSEIELAKQTGVSQGTVRKALDAMTAEHLLVRQQGRGTYVAVQEESQILFRYFRLRPDAGDQAFPESSVLTMLEAAANETERKGLHLKAGESVFRISRIRRVGETPVLTEMISLPLSRFSAMRELEELPNNVYQLYSERWGITVARADERLKAVLSEKEDVSTLGCGIGQPMLEISRVAYDLEDKPVELRISRCLTDNFHYRSELK